MRMFTKNHNYTNNNITENLKKSDNYIEKLKKLTIELNEKDNLINYIQEDYKKIFNIFPDMMILIDKDGIVFDANNTANKILIPLIKDSIIGKKWKNILKICNINWENTLEKKYIEDDYKKSLSKEIFMTSIKKYLLLNMIPVIREKDSYFILIAKDITEIKHRENYLLRKQELLSSIDDITNVFSHNLNINYILDKSVEILGRIKKVDTCYIYKNCIDKNENIYAEKIKEWKSPYGKKYSNNIGDFYYKLYLPRWLEYFKLNHIICGQLKDFPKNEKIFLSPENAKSICIVPIYTPLNLWGFLGLNSCEKSKYWKYDEEKLLKIAANIIGAGIYQWNLRNDETEIINKSCINF